MNDWENEVVYYFIVLSAVNQILVNDILCRYDYLLIKFGKIYTKYGNFNTKQAINNHLRDCLYILEI